MFITVITNKSTYNINFFFLISRHFIKHVVTITTLYIYVHFQNSQSHSNNNRYDKFQDGNRNITPPPKKKREKKTFYMTMCLRFGLCLRLLVRSGWWEEFSSICVPLSGCWFCMSSCLFLDLSFEFLLKGFGSSALATRCMKVPKLQNRLSS